MSGYLHHGDSGGIDEEGRAFVNVACEHCHWIGKHIPSDSDASEIDLIGFMGPDMQVDPSDSTAPSWYCQSCYESYQMINPLATPVLLKVAK
jgi:hypothetical protein